MTARTSAKRRAAAPRGPEPLQKAPSGIAGLDEITGGGLPRGRPTLVCGGPGCGKTLFGLEFLVRGATEYGEPGVFVSFEESEAELAVNVASLGFDLGRLVAEGKLAIDHVHVERSEIEETGEYDLEGLFIRMRLAIESVGARRVVLDTIESLFASMPNPLVIRSELRRLFRWLKDQGQTVVITGEQGAGTFTRQGLEEYVSDCVIVLDHRVTEQMTTRRLRVVKYRGSTHGTNEYPFLIDEAGFSVLPITSLGLQHAASRERVSTGLARLDEMLGGDGYYKGTTVLVSGTAGTGKTSVAALLARETCRRGERCLYFAFEESPDQLARNMRSIGVDLEPHVRDGSLRIVAARPYSHGLEMHLVSMHKRIVDFDPAVVVVDPLTNLVNVSTPLETASMLTRLIDFLKQRGTTALFTSLTSGTTELEQTNMGISSLIDTWLMLAVVNSGGERNRILTIIKSRGMAHSNQAAEYVLSDDGIHLVDTYLGSSGVLTGSARRAKEAEDLAEAATQAEELAQKQALRDSRRAAFEARLAALRAEFAAEDAEIDRSVRAAVARAARAEAERAEMAGSRRAFSSEAKAKAQRATSAPPHARPAKGRRR